MLPFLVKKQNQYPRRVNQLTIHYMYAFLTDNAILVSHFSCQLFLGKTIKERKKSRKRQRDSEIYPSHQVKWKLTGSLMLHAQNKKDSSLCSSVNVWESFVCNCAIHWEPRLHHSPVIPLEMCPRCSLALQGLFSRSKASSNELFGSLPIFVTECAQVLPGTWILFFFCLSFFPCWQEQRQLWVGMVKI